MKYKIIPSLIAKNQKELNQRIKKLKNKFETMQLDIMDGEFVSAKSLDFNFITPHKNYEAHLMIDNPEVWTIGNKQNVKTLIVHIESLRNPDEMIKLAKKEKKKLYFAVKPQTEISKVKKYLKKIDGVLILTVEPGNYGGRFIPQMLNKVKELRKLNKTFDIEVDGSMNPETIKLAKQAGANRFVVGSYLQKSKDINKTIKELKMSLQRKI